MNDNYIVFHLHDDTSNCNGYADSCTKFDEYIKLAKKNNMSAIAFSNHGGIYDWIKKKQYCDKYGIKYIHGIELYLCVNLQDNHRGFHIGLYAKNLEGVKELNSLISLSTSKGKNEDKSDRHFYYNPRISFEELMNTSDNIIVTTACLAGALWRLGDKEILNKENGEEAYNNNLENRLKLLKWLSKNKHRCFLEIQYHKCEHQVEYNKMLYEWSKEYDIPLIAGTDTHSSTKYKAECRKILQKAKDSFYGEEDEFDLTWKNYDELLSAFKSQNSLSEEVILEAVKNTNVFADMVEDFKLDKTYKYPTLYGDNSDKKWKKSILNHLKEKINIGAIDKKRINEYRQRVYEEFEAMSKQGMASFMLFMSELMTWCRDNNIHSSPCRGSVGGSLIAYITNITDVDPLIWGTVFSRFCNADRISLADIDEDFSPDDRKKVYEYIIERFGKDNVSYILSLNTIKDRGSIDVLAKGLDYKDLDVVKNIKNDFDKIFEDYSKIIQAEVNLEEIEGTENKSPNFDDHNLYLKIIRNSKAISEIENLKRQWDELREGNKDLFYYFDGIKNTIISKGNHPAGMIGSPITLYDNLGVFYRDGDEGFPVSSCSMKAVDSLNYVKFDILGLKTIGVLQDVYEYTNRKWQYAHEIDWNDKNVWEYMVKNSVGIFQFEGSYAFDLLKKFKPYAINDMSLVNASLRPSGKSYRDNLIDRKFNKNPSEQIDNLLKDNYGYLVFQEDTIKFLTDVCGFSGSLADTTRRAIGKKDIELLNQQLPKILEGYCSMSAKPRKIAEEEAKKFIQIISDSSEYQFGLNHSTGYSMNGYIAAYNRYYYPLEFATAYLNRAENEEDINNGMSFVRSKGFRVQRPQFGYSKGKYFFDKNTNIIYKGLGSVKDISIKDGDELYALSKKKKYSNFIELYEDVKSYTNVHDGKIKALIKLDFFKEYGYSSYLLNIIEIYNNFSDIKQISKNKIDSLGLSEVLIKRFSNKETKSLYKEIDNKGLINYLVSKLENIDIPIKDKLQAEMYHFGYIETIFENVKDLYYATKIDVYKNKNSITYYIHLYDISSGENIKWKVKDFFYFAENPINEKDLIRVIDSTEEPKKTQIEVIKNGIPILDKNGKVKKKWVETGEMWKVLKIWEVY